MNVSNQILMHIKAGSLPAQDMIDFLLAKKPNAVGYVVQETDGKPLDVSTEDGANLSAEDLRSITHDAKDLNRTLYFANLAKDHDPADVQPITIDDPEGGKFIALMLEGDIAGNNADKSHTEQYNLINGVLVPQIVEICEDFEGDLTKIMAKIRKDTFSNSFFMHVGERAVLHIMPVSGEPYMLAKNKLHKTFDWGWVSHAEGYGEKAQAPAVAEAPKRRGFGASRSTVRETVAEAAKANADKPTLTVVQKPKASVPATPIEANVMIKPPEWLHRNTDVKYFYETLTGAIPSAWKKKIAVKPTQNLDLLKVANLDEFTNYRLAKAMQTTGGNTKQERLSSTAAPAPQPEQVPTLPANPDQPIHGPVDPTPLPIIDKGNLQKLLDLVATLDHNSKEMMDPKEMQAIEAKIDKFSTQVGLKGIEETMNWKVSDLFALAATDPKAMVLFALEWRSYGRPYLIAELKNKAKTNQPTTVETTTTQLTPNTTKTESIARPARGKWGKRAA